MNINILPIWVLLSIYYQDDLISDQWSIGSLNVIRMYAIDMFPQVVYNLDFFFFFLISEIE